MQITFDPHEPKDVAAIGVFLAAAAAGVTAAPSQEVMIGQTNDLDESIEDIPDYEPVTNGSADEKAGVELDSNGTPWLQDVHATTKSQNKDGTWKKKRGVADDVLENAEAAARAKIAKTPDATLPTEEEQATVAEMPTPETLAPATMNDLATVYGEALELGAITPEEVSALYRKNGCQTLEEVKTNETARAGIVADIRAAIASHGADTTGAVLPGM